MAVAGAAARKTTPKKKSIPPVGMHNKSRKLIDGNLTVEQEAYCRARAMGMSVEEAVKAAGIKTAIKTVKDWEYKVPGIKKRVNELSSLATKNAIIQTGLDRQWVIERYMQVVTRCMQHEPVMVDGQPTGEYKFDSSGANVALRALGDTLGLFKPVEKKPGDDFAQLSDDDIARIARDLAEQTGMLTFNNES